MTATEISFVKFMQENREKKLLIPIYQRAYEWTINKDKEVWKLWEDIDNIDLDDENSTHFINSIVYIEDDKVDNAINIIDGQQRITTLSTMFIAIRDRLITLLSEIEKALKKDKENQLLQTNKRKVNNEIKRVSNFYIAKDIYDSEDERIRLSLSNKNSDRKIYNELVDGNVIDKKSNIYKTYNFFYTKNSKDIKIQIKKFSFEEIKTLLQKLERVMIVKVHLELGKDNPQIVFSSLNNGGLRLKDTDLIKNTVFMEIPDRDVQEKLHSELWEILEKDFNDKEFAIFVQHYLTMKIGRVVTNNSIYEEFVNKYFKSIDGESSEKVQVVLEDMLRFKDIFISLKRGDYFKKDSVLKHFNIEAYYPFLMLLKSFNSPYFTQITKIIESYYVRRFVSSLSAGYTKNVFALACKDVSILNSIKNNLDPVYKFKKFMNNKENLQRFPKDGEFKSNFETTPIYQDSSIITKAILVCFENQMNINSTLDDEYFSELSVEHILPKDNYNQLKSCWQENFSEIEHQSTLHTIGNLTLLTSEENSSNGTKCFDNKVEIFSNSELYINREVAEYDQWNKSTIEDRTNKFIDIALKRWENIDV